MISSFNEGWQRQSQQLGSALALFAAVLLLVTLAVSSASAEEPIVYGTVESGHSAMWFDPSRDGEGWALEVLADDQALLYWFTFDELGNPRWLAGLGEIQRDEEGDAIVFDELLAPHGARFGPEYDPAAVIYENKGHATLRFVDCDHGVIEFDAFGQQGSHPLSRLTRTMGAGCGPIHGSPGEVVQAYAGQSGSWFDPAFDGQGFSLNWLADGAASVVWFTFDANGQPYWLTGVGARDGEQLVFPELLSTRGGRFGEDFDPQQVVHTGWGELTLTLDCDAGHADYHSTAPGFVGGSFELSRLSRLVQPSCPWVKPTLSDLYELTLTVLPTPTPGAPPASLPGSSNLVWTRGVADDGTVVGVRRLYTGDSMSYRAVRLDPGATAWRDVYDMDASGVFVAADGKDMLINRRTGGPAFIRDGEVVPMPGLVSPAYSRVIDAADDLSFAVGEVSVRMANGSWTSEYWIWSAADGARKLPTSETRFGAAMCVSNDGKTVIGTDTQVDIAGYSSNAVRWLGTGLPTYLADTDGSILTNPAVCSSDGRVVYGTLQPHEEPRESWAWTYGAPGFWSQGKLNTGMGLMLPTADEPYGQRYGVRYSNADGSLVGGDYQSPRPYGMPYDGPIQFGGMLWTQNTGHVALPVLLQALELSLDWPSMMVEGISANGEYVLLTSGQIPQTPARGEPSTKHLAMLRLVKK